MTKEDWFIIHWNSSKFDQISSLKEQKMATAISANCLISVGIHCSPSGKFNLDHFLARTSVRTIQLSNMFEYYERRVGDDMFSSFL